MVFRDPASETSPHDREYRSPRKDCPHTFDSRFKIRSYLDRQHRAQTCGFDAFNERSKVWYLRPFYLCCRNGEWRFEDKIAGDSCNETVAALSVMIGSLVVTGTGNCPYPCRLLSLEYCRVRCNLYRRPRCIAFSWNGKNGFPPHPSLSFDTTPRGFAGDEACQKSNRYILLACSTHQLLNVDTQAKSVACASCRRTRAAQRARNGVSFYTLEGPCKNASYAVLWQASPVVVRTNTPSYMGGGSV